MKNKIFVIYSVLKILGIFQGLVIIFKIITKTSGNIHLSNIKFPFLLRPNTSDFSTFCQIFLKKEYEVKIDIIPKVIIDGGANIGLFTIIMKNRFVNAKIICIEPDPDNFVTLIENVKTMKI